jgi:hypothetical protein
MPELSVLIPARNEAFLPQTVDDLLAHREADTEVIVVQDGPPFVNLAERPRLRVINVPASIGQRAAQNLAARASTARYVMKVDAHCAFDQGFDRKLLAAIPENAVVVPQMRNLHVYNWVCDFCGALAYQGPRPAKCPECEGAAFHQDVVWIPKPNPSSSAYRFNKELRFKYFPELRARQGRSGLQETMSLQGSCFLAAREQYWARELCDEAWGSWGQQGSEVALKTWLSGGRVLCLMDTWYAHQFRVKAGDALQYPGVGASQSRAISISQETFLNDRWPGQVYPLAWLLERFWTPLQEVGDKEARWEQADLDRLRARPFTVAATGQVYSRPRTGGMVYYTDSVLDEAIAAPVRAQLATIGAERGLPIVTAALGRRLSFGTKNIRFHSHKRGVVTMLRQILAGLENSSADYVFLTEHDVLYHPSHFDFAPARDDTFYYNVNVWHVRYPDGHAVRWDDCQQVSGCCASRALLLDFYRARLAQVERDGFNRHYEPGLKQTVGGQRVENWQAAYANLDIRHGANLTPSKWSTADFRNAVTGWQETDELPGWGRLVEVLGGVLV